MTPTKLPDIIRSYLSLYIGIAPVDLTENERRFIFRLNQALDKPAIQLNSKGEYENAF